MVKNSSSLRGVLTALVGFALFAAHDALIKALGQSYSAVQIVFFAMLFAFPPMSVLIMTDSAVDNFKPKLPGLLVLRSSLLIVAMMGAFYAFSVLPLTEVYALLFVMPLLSTVLSIPLLGETVRFWRWAAVLVGLAGVLIVLRPGASAFTLGHAAALTAAGAAATAGILVRKIGRRERSALLVLYPMVLAVVVMGAALPAVYRPIATPHLGAMALVGVLSIAGQFCVIHALRAAPPSLVAPMQYSQILWATLYGAVFFQEIPDAYVGFGAVVIILSGVFIVWRETLSDVSEHNPVLNSPGPRLDTASPLKWSGAKPASDGAPSEASSEASSGGP